MIAGDDVNPIASMTLSGAARPYSYRNGEAASLEDIYYSIPGDTLGYVFDAENQGVLRDLDRPTCHTVGTCTLCPAPSQERPG